MWCLEDYQVRYFRNKLTIYSLTVVYRRPDKVVYLSNSLCFFVVHVPTHLSLEICTFRCLVGHVFQRSGPVDRNMCETMVNMYVCIKISWKFLWSLPSPCGLPLWTRFSQVCLRSLKCWHILRIWIWCVSLFCAGMTTTLEVSSPHTM
jgi:hypothetical protein